MEDLFVDTSDRPPILSQITRNLIVIHEETGEGMEVGSITFHAVDVADLFRRMDTLWAFGSQSEEEKITIFRQYIRNQLGYLSDQDVKLLLEKNRTTTP